MINYQGQMYGVFKTFGGGRRYEDKAEEEFFKTIERNKMNKPNINISINVNVNDVLDTVLKYIDNKCRQDENNELVEGIYFK